MGDGETRYQSEKKKKGTCGQSDKKGNMCPWEGWGSGHVYISGAGQKGTKKVEVGGETSRKWSKRVKQYTPVTTRGTGPGGRKFLGGLGRGAGTPLRKPLHGANPKKKKKGSLYHPADEGRGRNTTR